MKKVRYRLDISYYTRDYETKECSTSRPIYTAAEGWKAYKQAIKEKCIDDPTAPARVHFWKYGPTDARGWLTQGETLARNF